MGKPPPPSRNKTELTSRSDRVEVEWKWLLLADPADYHLPKASSNAIPMPASRKAKDKLKARRADDDKPRKDDPFSEGYTWAEFQLQPVSNNAQVKIDLSKQDQVWYYLGKTSTEARSQFTEDPSKPRYNYKGNFLETVPRPPKRAPAALPQRRVYQPAPYSGTVYPATGAISTPSDAARLERPYVYKPRQHAAPNAAPNCQPQGAFTTQRFTAAPAPAHSHQRPTPKHYSYVQAPAHQQPQAYSAQRFQAKTPQNWAPHGNHSHLNPGITPQVQQNQRQGAVPGMLSYRPQSVPAPVSLPPPPAPVSVQSRPPIKGTWHVHSSIYQKYPFFQVHHNRYAHKRSMKISRH